MARKKDVVKKIDQKTTNTGSPLPLIQEDQPAPPAFYLIPAPDTLVEIGQAIQRSTQAPLVSVALGWQEAPNIAPDYYNVEWDISSAFTDVQRKRASTTSATIDGLQANGVTYYFRVQAVLGGIYSPFSDTLTVVTMTDVTAAPDVTGLTGTFVSGDLLITWTNPNSEVFKDVVIRIYDITHTTLYATLYSANQQIIWTAEQNLDATSQVGATSVYIDARTRSWGNTYSAGVNTTATSSAPSTPSPTFNWTGDIGLDDEDLRIQWVAIANADSYDLLLDGNTYKTRDLGFTYRYEQNRVDHVPTLVSGDATLTYLLYARNKLNQISTPASGTIANAAPPSSLMSLSVLPGFSQIAANVALLSGAIIQDFDHYNWTVSSGSGSLQSFISYTPDVTILVSGSGNYSVTVAAVDKFNQSSAGVTVAGITMDVLTIDQLRTEASYTDSSNNTQTTLKILKDGVGWGASNPSILYTASTAWKWIKVERPLIDRYKTFSISYSQVAGGAFPIYVTFDDGNGNINYASGPITLGSVNQSILTLYSTEANAISNAVDITTVHADARFDLPSIVEARKITLNFKATTQDVKIYEYYPRRLVQSDDIEAENIKSINVAAGAITADKISVINLQAVSAQMGALHMDGVIDIATGGGIYQGSGSFASPTTGLKIFNSSGVGKISGYNGGTEQITLDTDGKFKAGAGNVVLDVNGVTILTANTYVPTQAYRVAKADGTLYGTLDGTYPSLGGSHTLRLQTSSITGENSTLEFDAFAPSAKTASISFIVKSGTVFYTILNASTDGTTNAVTIDALNTSGSITLGSPTYTSYELYIGQTTYKFYWESANSRLIWNTAMYVTGTFVAGADIYWGSGADYLTNWFNQKLLTTNSPTFAGLSLSQSGSTSLNIITTSGSSKRGQIVFYQSASTLWNVGVDVSGNNTNDLYFFDAVNNQTRMDIGPAGNVQIQQKLYIGAIGTTPTALIHLNTDSALKPTTNTWQTTSTKQAKENIKVRTSALDRISKLSLKEFDYNGKYHTEKGAKGIGFIAEELRQIYPNAVSEMEYENEDGSKEVYLAANPHEIFMDYALAIQELKAEIEALKNK